MLEELVVENLVLVPSARLSLHPGLNVLTGETGAGKTILAEAVGLLLGGRADASLVGPAANVRPLFAAADPVAPVAPVAPEAPVAPGTPFAPVAPWGALRAAPVDDL